MKRKTKIFISSAVILTLAAFIIYNILSFNSFKKDLNSSSFDKKNFESIYITKIKLKRGVKMKINIKFDEKTKIGLLNLIDNSSEQYIRVKVLGCGCGKPAYDLYTSFKSEEDIEVVVLSLIHI